MKYRTIQVLIDRQYSRCPYTDLTQKDISRENFAPLILVENKETEIIALYIDNGLIKELWTSILEVYFTLQINAFSV